jgi:hypothetical protein
MLGRGRNPRPSLFAEAMMMPRIPLIPFLMAALLGLPAHAADNSGQFAIKGAGLQRCERFLDTWKEGGRDLALYGGWIEGYVTGINQHVGDVFDLAPWQTTETLLGLTKLACEQKPDQQFSLAFNQVVRLLLATPLTSISPVDTVGRRNVGTPIYREIVRRAEQKLADRGYDPGEIDGIFDGVTIEALLAFQRGEGLTETGLPDQPTLTRLLLN